MAIIKCKMCGGDLNLIAGASTAACDFCGSVQTIPNLDDEKKLIQFERAERLRRQCEFDKAAGIYKTIVADFRQEAEAYWGLVLCKYGIEYVDDPATGKKIPTCHRSSFDSIMEDSDFEQVMENADLMARRVYRDEAKQIEEIRKGIIAVSANEQPYDIFICYKETAENGNRTLDSVLAQDVYNALTDKGYRVFFSRISLEDKLGVEYEPYIFAALNSAKVMLVFGTDYEYFNAVWVKNEWSRFLKLMAKDKEKHLIPCFKGIDAYDMPKEFARLQAQDLGKVGAVQDLLRGIDKLLSRQQAMVKETVYAPSTASSPSVQSLLQRTQLFLEDGEWKTADDYCEKVLDIEPQNAWAYLYKMMAQMRVHTQGTLAELEDSFEENPYYIRALRYADAELTAILRGYLESAKRNAANIQKERIYQEAVANANQLTAAGFKSAINLFSQISDYKDAEDQLSRYQKYLHDMLESIRAREEAERERLAAIERAERAKKEEEERRLAEIGTGSLVLLVRCDGGWLASADGTTYQYEIFRNGVKIQEVLVEAGKTEATKTIQLQSGAYSVSVNVFGYNDKSLKDSIHKAGPITVTVQKNKHVTVATKRSLFSSKILSVR